MVGGNTTTTLTTSPNDPQATFVLLEFEGTGQLWKAGYDIRLSVYYIRFEVNIAEVRGFAGTCKLSCTVKTNLAIWGSIETYGGVFEIDLAANQQIMELEILFDVSSFLYEQDGLDWSTSSVIIIYA